MGWRQTGIWFLAIISCVLTCLQYVFSIIPVYEYNPSLDIFLASKVPFISCIANQTPSKITIDNETYDTAQICEREIYPLYVWQQLQRTDTGSLIIAYWNGASTYITWPASWSLKRDTSNTGTTSISQYNISLMKWTDKTYIPETTWYAFHPQQYTLASDFTTSKKLYLKQNYKRVWEEAPLLTEIAIRKMRAMSIIDWSYTTKIKNLQFYMDQTQNK